MSERQEIYRYAVDKECATAAANMTNGVFATVRPRLEGEAQAVERKTADFLAALQVFLVKASDPTGLESYSLREQARELSRHVEKVSGLLTQLAGSLEGPS